MRVGLIRIVVATISLGLNACGGDSGRDSAGAAIAAGVPDTDIYLIPMRELGSAPDPADMRNITARPGYDNQPAFIPDEQALLFSSIQDGRQADIYRYDFGRDLLDQLTDTPESEYSPTPFGERGEFSVVRVEADGAQRLWAFAADGSAPNLLLPQWRTVGYHAWVDARRVLAFLVNDVPQLALIDIESGIAEVLATGIGRSIHYRADSDRISFMDIVEEDRPMIITYRLRGGERRELIAPRPDAQDYVFGSDNSILMAEGKTIYRSTLRRPAWKVWADLSNYLPGPISRIAVSEDERWVAFVVTVAPEG